MREQTHSPNRLFAWLIAGQLALIVAGAFLPPRATLGYLLAIACLATGLWIALRAAKPEDRIFLVLLFAGAFVVRLVLGIGFHLLSIYGGDTGLYFPDSFRYDRLGRAIAYRIREFGMEELSVITKPVFRGYNAYTGLFYYYLGDSIGVLKVMQAFLGALLAIPTYLIGVLMWNRRIARFASTLVAFYPSLIFWSAMHLKDTLAVLFLVIFVLFDMRFIANRKPADLLGLVLTFSCTFLLRPYVAAILAALFLLHLLVQSAKTRWVIPLRLALAAVACLIAAPILIEQSEFRWAAHSGPLIVLDFILRNNMYTSGSSFSAVAITDWQSYLRFLPGGVIHFILTPLPWKAEGIYRFLIPEVLLRYALLPFMLYGFWISLRSRFRAALPMIVLPIPLILTYATVFLGGGPRHQAQLIPFLALFAAIGISRWKWGALPYAVYVALLVAGGATYKLGLMGGGALVGGALLIPACIAIIRGLLPTRPGGEAESAAWRP